MNVSGIFIGETHFFLGRATLSVSKVPAEEAEEAKEAEEAEEAKEEKEAEEAEEAKEEKEAEVEPVSIGITAGFLPRQTRGITFGSTGSTAAVEEPVSVVIAVEAIVGAVEAMVKALETRVEASVPVIAVDPIDEASVPVIAVDPIDEASVPVIAVDPIDEASVPVIAVESFFAGRQTTRFRTGCCDFRLTPPSIYSILYSII